MIHAGIARLSSDFDAMVIANQAPNFPWREFNASC